MHPECVQVCAHWAVGCGSVERSIGLSEAGRRGLWAVWLGEQTRQIIIISDTYCLVLTYHFYWYWANNNVCIIIISSPKYLNVLLLTQDSRLKAQGTPRLSLKSYESTWFKQKPNSKFLGLSLLNAGLVPPSFSID